MIVKSGYSRDKSEYDFKPFNLTNNRPYQGHVCAIDNSGFLRNCKITSIKTWKRKPDMEIHWKYGLYEFGYSLLTPDGFAHGVTLGTAKVIEKEG